MASFDRAEPQGADADNSSGVSIALSGGGHRAAIWALGGLLALAGSRVNARTSSIASVSGGGITNAMLLASQPSYDRHTFDDSLAIARKLARALSGSPTLVRTLRSAGVVAAILIVLFAELPSTVRWDGQLIVSAVLISTLLMALHRLRSLAQLEIRRQLGRIWPLALPTAVLALPGFVAMNAIADRSPTEWLLVLGLLAFQAIGLGAYASNAQGTLWGAPATWFYAITVAGIAALVVAIWWTRTWSELPWSSGTAVVAGAVVLLVPSLRLLRSGWHRRAGFGYSVTVLAALVPLVATQGDWWSWPGRHNLAQVGVFVFMLLLLGEMLSLRTQIAAEAFRYSLGGLLPLSDAIPFTPGPAAMASFAGRSGPLHVFCSAELNTGRQTFFCPDFAYNEVLGLGRVDGLKLHQVVQLSANLPGAFPAQAIPRGAFNFHRGDSTDVAKLGPFLLFSDGGVLNNMADDWALRLGPRLADIRRGLRWQTTNTRESGGASSQTNFDGLLEKLERSVLAGHRNAGPERLKPALFVLNATGDAPPVRRSSIAIPLLGEFALLTSVTNFLYAESNANRRLDISQRIRTGEIAGAIVQIDESPVAILESVDPVQAVNKQRAESYMAQLDLGADLARVPLESIVGPAANAADRWAAIAQDNARVATTLDPIGVEVSARLLFHAYTLAAVRLCLGGFDAPPAIGYNVALAIARGEVVGQMS